MKIKINIKRERKKLNTVLNSPFNNNLYKENKALFDLYKGNIYRENNIDRFKKNQQMKHFYSINMKNCLKIVVMIY